jgi:outer membrane protease
MRYDEMQIINKSFWITILLIIGLFATVQSVSASPGDDFSLSIGRQVDFFQYSIAGNGVNILSELTWRNVNVLQIGGTFNKSLTSSLSLAGTFGYGFIANGTCQDSDYNSDNCTDEYSRSYSSSNGDYTLDFSCAARYYPFIPSDDLQFSLLAGISLQQQHFRLTNGFQALSTDPSLTTGPFSGLNSTYSTQWLGPWVGMNFDKKIVRRLMFHCDYGYHFAMTYSGTGDWNLRTDLAHPDSFQDTATGNGYELGVGFEYFIAPLAKLQLKMKYENYNTVTGHDQTFYSDGSTAFTQFNDAKLETHTIMLSFIQNF